MNFRTPVVLTAAVTALGILAALPAGAYPPQDRPCCVAVDVLSSSEITVSWPPVTADPAVTGYKIEREFPVGGGFTTIIADTGSTVHAYNDSGLTPGQMYSYRVSAINADGVGPASTNLAAASTYTMQIPLPPDVPKNFVASPVSGSQINLSWTAPTSVTAITGYRIDREFPIGGGFTGILNTSSTATTYTDTNLSPGATYNYRIFANNTYGQSYPSAQAAATTLMPPSAPQNAQATPGDGQATVQWTPPYSTGGGITGYVVAAATSTTVAGTATSTVITGLTNGMSYSFGVSAINPAGQSPVVTTNAVTPTPAPILTVPATTTPATTPSPATVVPPLDTQAIQAQLTALFTSFRSLQTQANEQQNTTTSPATVASATPPPTFSGERGVGSSGDDILALQNFLIMKNAGPWAQQLKTHGATAYFGTLTKAALLEFQKSVGIAGANGHLGPATRAYFGTLAVPIASATTTPATPLPTPPPTFSDERGVGSSGDDILALQNFLIAKNAGPWAQQLKTHGATAYFGTLTKAALLEFQKSVGIAGANGHLGPATRAYFNALPR